MSKDHWMRDLPSELRDLSIINLAIPGTDEIIVLAELIEESAI